MGSEFQHSWCMTFTALIYLSLLLQPATGKCVGKWAIHSCFGGSGKRSDPSLTETVDQQKENNLLRQLLLPERFRSGSRLDESEDQQEVVEPSLVSYDEEVPERPTLQRQRDVDTLNNMLRTLLLQRKIRLAAEGLA